MNASSTSGCLCGEGVADRRIRHGNTKFTCLCRSGATAQAQTRLGDIRLELAENHRDRAHFNLAIESKLRGCDLVQMKVVDVMASGQINERASILQSKAQKPVCFEISQSTQASLERRMPDPMMVESKYLWPGRFHISTRQYARIVRDWVMSIGLETSAYGTHSIRRTNVAQIYKKTGNLRAVQLLLGHTKMESIARYLGVELEDAFAILSAVEINGSCPQYLSNTVNPEIVFQAAHRRWCDPVVPRHLTVSEPVLPHGMEHAAWVISQFFADTASPV